MGAVDKITSWIPCNETSGVRVNAHTSGSTYDLAEVNSVEATAGIKGNAANIVTANNERLINSNGLYHPAVNFSYGVWVQNILGNGTSTFRVLGCKFGSLNADRQWLLQLEWSGGDPFLTFQVYHNGSGGRDSFPQNVSALNLPSDASPGWTFVSATRTNSPSDRLIIRVDDNAPYVKLITNTVVYTGGTDPFQVGRSTSFGGLNADEIIWCESDALNDAEHLELWNGGVGVTYEDIFVPAVPPDAPSNLTATAIASHKIALAWTDNSDDETGFKVERSLTGTGGWTLVQTTAADATTYTDTGLTPGVEHFYRISATNAEGDSAYTQTESATTLSGTPTVVLTSRVPTVVLTDQTPTVALTDQTPTVELTML